MANHQLIRYAGFDNAVCQHTDSRPRCGHHGAFSPLLDVEACIPKNRTRLRFCHGNSIGMNGPATPTMCSRNNLIWPMNRSCSSISPHRPQLQLCSAARPRANGTPCPFWPSWRSKSGASFTRFCTLQRILHGNRNRRAQPRRCRPQYNPTTSCLWPNASASTPDGITRANGRCGSRTGSTKALVEVATAPCCTASTKNGVDQKEVKRTEEVLHHNLGAHQRFEAFLLLATHETGRKRQVTHRETSDWCGQTARCRLRRSEK